MSKQNQFKSAGGPWAYFLVRKQSTLNNFDLVWLMCKKGMCVCVCVCVCVVFRVEVVEASLSSISVDLLTKKSVFFVSLHSATTTALGTRVRRKVEESSKTKDKGQSDFVLKECSSRVDNDLEKHCKEGVCLWVMWLRVLGGRFEEGSLSQVWSQRSLFLVFLHWSTTTALWTRIHEVIFRKVKFMINSLMKWSCHGVKRGGKREVHAEYESKQWVQSDLAQWYSWVSCSASAKTQQQSQGWWLNSREGWLQMSKSTALLMTSPETRMLKK